MPLAKKAAGVAKKILKSKVVRKTGNQLLNAGIETGGEVLASALTGKNVGEAVQSKLNEAREQIAETIRSGTKRKKSSDKAEEAKPRQRKRKKIRVVARKSLKPSTKSQSKYSIFDENDSN